MVDEVEFEIRDGEKVTLSFSSEDMTWDEFLATYGAGMLGKSAWREYDKWLGGTVG